MTTINKVELSTDDYSFLLKAVRILENASKEATMQADHTIASNCDRLASQLWEFVTYDVVELEE